MKSSIFLLGAALFLAACDATTTADGPRAGGEDFPNTLEALGRTLATGADSSQSWNSLDSAQAQIEGDSLLADTSMQTAARRMDLLCSDRLAEGLLPGTEIYFKSTTKCLPGLGRAHDSIALTVDPNAAGGKDTAFRILSVDTVLLRYQVLTTVVDADGDGKFLLRNDPGKVWLEVLKTSGRWTLRERSLLGPGIDGLYTPGEDNWYYAHSKTLFLDRDTVEHQTFEPKIPGRAILAGQDDSAPTWVAKLQIAPNRRRTERALFQIFRDEKRNHPLFFAVRTLWNGGTVHDELVYGDGPDSLLVLGDTVTYLNRAKNGTDSVNLRVKAILSRKRNDRTGDSLLSVRLERLRPGRSERYSLWELVSDAPVANGQDAKSGTLHARVEFANGTWIEFRGTWTAGVFSGTARTPSDSSRVVVGRDGTIESANPL